MSRPNIAKYKGQIGEILKDENNFRFLPVSQRSYRMSELDTVTMSEVDEASEEDKITFLKETFVWGKILKVHTIGEYQIIEYINRLDNERKFAGYIDYDDVCRSYSSLDAALAGVIAIKYEGLNGKADSYFMTILENTKNTDFR